MKTILLLVASLFASAAFASVEPASIRAYNIQACDFWNYHNSTQGTPGWLCSTLPGRITVPDAYSVSDEIKALQQKITTLEDRIAVLEKLLPKP